MSTFSTPVVKILSVEDHPNADRLSIVKVLGYTCISGKLEDGSHRYSVGDYVVYIPSASVLPEWLLKRLDFWNNEKNIGGLSGKEGNRVKPLRLRGIFSEGVLYPTYVDHGYQVLDTNDTMGHVIGKLPDVGFEGDVIEGRDVSEMLGITKYDPPIPAHMAGEVFYASGADPVKYDIESYENNPAILRDGEEVVITEKLHGTFTGIGIIPRFSHDDTFESVPGQKNVIIYSKGLGAGGKCFKNVDANTNNVYVKAFNAMSIEQKALFNTLAEQHGGIHLLGETFGKGVQDLHYGQTAPTFRVFDAYIGSYPIGRYANDDELTHILTLLDIPRVPVLARIQFSYDAVVVYRDGKDTISKSNVREGVVVRPVLERRDDSIGRVQLKFVSPDYKLRKGSTSELS